MHDFYQGYLDASPDGRFIAAATSGRGQEDLYVIATQDGAIRQLTNDFARDRAPRWTRDGRHILFYSDRSGEYSIWSIDADGCGLRQLTNAGWRGYPVLSPDGSRLVTDDIATHRMFIYDMRDLAKPPEMVPPNPNSSVFNLLTTSWSRDGTPILYTTLGAGETTVWMYSVPERTHRRITPGRNGIWLADGRRFLYSTAAGTLRLFDLSSGSGTALLTLPGELITGASMRR